MNFDLNEILTGSWNRMIKSENLVPLMVGALIVMIGGGLTFGILLGPLMVGYLRMCRRALDDEPLEIGQISDGFSDFARSFVLALVIGVAALVTACTVIGMIAVMFFTMFAFQIIAFDEDIGAVDAIKRSFELVKANIGPCALVFLIGVAINSILSGTFILGIPAFAFMMLMNTTLFLRLDAAPSAVAAQPA